MDTPVKIESYLSGTASDSEKSGSVAAQLSSASFPSRKNKKQVLPKTSKKEEKRFIRTLNPEKEIPVDITLEMLDTHEKITEEALLDCGTHEVDVILWFKGHKERVTFEICEIGKADTILGLPWLQKHNPDINWITGEIKMSRCL